MTALDELVDTLLWEGHQLYPYTPSATKNLTPTPFGIVYPPAYAAGSPHTFARLKVQCIAAGTGSFWASVVCLQGGEERRLEVAPGELEFAFGPVTGRVVMGYEDFGELVRVSVTVLNETEVPAGLSRSEALEFALLSTHVVVRCGGGGRFMSPIAPPEMAATAVMTCANVNTFPVLAADDDTAVLGAAIMLPDHPQLAPESRGSLFDSTEIEEALLLHVLTLTDAERGEITDPKVLEMMQRAIRTTPEEYASLRGEMRISSLEVDGVTFVRGGRVRLHPEPGRNAQDHLLDGRPATIERIYVDYEDKVHLCVTVDDDPGQDIMRDIGRYLYFKPDEVEVIA